MLRCRACNKQLRNTNQDLCHECRMVIWNNRDDVEINDLHAMFFSKAVRRKDELL